jgi:ribosomal 50S subunit-recycling heat shock protein
VSKSSRTVHAGDEITLRRRHRILSVRVIALPATKQVPRHEASSLYEILRDEALAEDWN